MGLQRVEAQIVRTVCPETSSRTHIDPAGGNGNGPRPEDARYSPTAHGVAKGRDNEEAAFCACLNEGPSLVWSLVLPDRS